MDTLTDRMKNELWKFDGKQVTHNPSLHGQEIKQITKQNNFS